MLTLAQIATPPEGVEAWLKVFFWLMGGLGSAIFVWQQMTGRGLKEVHGRIKRERAEIDANIKRVEASTEKLETELKLNTTATAAMGGTLTAMNGTLSTLANSFNQFLHSRASRHE